MKYTTEYLFDYKKEFFEPELTNLATKRIESAKKLLLKLSKSKKGLSYEDSEELRVRYLAVHKSLRFWEKILDE